MSGGGGPGGTLGLIHLSGDRGASAFGCPCRHAGRFLRTRRFGVAKGLCDTLVHAATDDADAATGLVSLAVATAVLVGHPAGNSSTFHRARTFGVGATH